ncbi:S41 family peptidase [Janthinobacterium sp.]|uniref:S41 family peptidase n=1 Tax=Janthinobacterium sp. TaxID=1871054 RepID=UPI00262D3195|nr:S41 family peptidase [Janthinobacterium sp.]
MKALQCLSLASLLMLAACGGGGDSSAPATSTPGNGGSTGNGGNNGGNNGGATVLAPSSTLANRCEKPRAGNSTDKPGTLRNEQDWVRSWIDESYLWYNEVPNTYLAQNYSTAPAYFDVLKTYATTASGKQKDQFHFTYTTAEWEASQSGVEFGYGFLMAYDSLSPPRKAVVAMIEPGSPAALAGLQRGDVLQRVDGVDFVNAGDTASVDTLNAGIFPDQKVSHTLVFSRNGTPISATMTAGDISTTAVQNTKVITTPTGKVGYLTFNTHNYVSERQLIEAMQSFQTAGVSDLVLDVRYNGGGLLDVASELAYMIAGPQQTTGKTFEQTVYNDKTKPDAPVPFHARSIGFAAPNPVQKNIALPYLGLKKVTVLTTAGTCSASEAIINGLRGVDVEVNLIGGTTCGKPYGFYPQPNCGTTYFAINFKGVNAKGFGDYADGIAPTCAASDDYQHALGDPAEGMLALALQYRNNKSCSLPTGKAQLLSQSVESSATAMRLLRPQYREISVR